MAGRGWVAPPGFLQATPPSRAPGPRPSARPLRSVTQVIQVLLDQGGTLQLSRADQHGWLPLHHAALNSKSARVVHLLLEAGGVAQLSVGDNKGSLPIHLVVSVNATGPSRTIRVQLFAARTLNVTDQSRTTLSLR